MVLLWIGVGFAAFGFLVGTTAGLSSAELTVTLLGLLFALIGGSVGALLGKLDAEGRKLAGVALLAFSLTATFGLYSGIYVRINDLLRKHTVESAASVEPTPAIASASDYLKSNPVALIDFLQLEMTRDRMTLPEACDVLEEQAGLEGGE